MRKPEEIKAVCNIIEKIRLKCPELRFVQLLWYLNIITEDNDWFYKENDVLFKDQTVLPQRDVLIIKYMENGKLIHRRLRYIENSTLWWLIEWHKEWSIRKDYEILKEELEFREKNNIYI